MKQEAPTPREPRLPLHAPVVTDPALVRCFSINISSTGIALACSGDAGALREGARLQLQLALPGAPGNVRADARVIWTFARPARTGTGFETLVGAAFTDMRGADRTSLSRYLLEHRHHVAVAFADESDRALLRVLAGDFYELHFDDSEAGLSETLSRGDISALIIFGSDQNPNGSVGARVFARLSDPDRQDALPQDLLPSVIYCGPSGASDLLRLVNSGLVYRVLSPPIDATALGVAVQKACAAHGERLEQARVSQRLERVWLRDLAGARSEPALDETIRARIVCESPALARSMARLRRVAPHKVSVLLVGETGAGKEVLARLLHELSPRADGALVVQDCGTLPNTLLDSALFGHVKGAFTGAVADHPGLFVLGDGGTVFLDEIENTTPELQAKLLRVLETGEVRPVGGSKVRHVDVRVVAATNVDLQEATRAGRFRDDLYYRLNVFPIRVPPLRERKEDILPLAERFLRAACVRFGRRPGAFSASARAALLRHAWPGNVRELQNAVEAAVLMLDTDQSIGVHLLPEALQGKPAGRTPGALRARVRAFERDLISGALAQHDGVLRQAALALDADPVTLRRKAIAYGLLP